MRNFVYLAGLHQPLAKRENNLVSAAESLSSSHIGEVFGGEAWGLAPPQPLIMDNIFLKTESTYDTYYVPWYMII